MLTNETISKLNETHLGTMASHFADQLPDLLVEIAVARGSGTYRELMRKHKKVSLLILDEWLLYSLKKVKPGICWN